MRSIDRIEVREIPNLTVASLVGMARSARPRPGRKTAVMRADWIPRQARTLDRPRPRPDSAGRCGEDHPSGDLGQFSASPPLPCSAVVPMLPRSVTTGVGPKVPSGPRRKPPATARRTVGESPLRDNRSTSIRARRIRGRHRRRVAPPDPRGLRARHPRRAARRSGRAVNRARLSDPRRATLGSYSPFIRLL